MQRKSKKLLAILLVAFMMFGMMPSMVFVTVDDATLDITGSTLATVALTDNSSGDGAAEVTAFQASVTVSYDIII